MDVKLSPELEDDWFIREVEEGLAAADHGEFFDHEDVGKLIDSRFPADGR